MERLTVKRDKKNVFQSIYYAECEQYKGGCVLISCPFDCPCEIEQELFNRLGEIEDILGDEYDLDRLKVLVNQQMTMREEVAERFRITKDIPVDRLRELAEADRDGRCVVLPCKVGDELFYSDGEWIGKETVEKIVIDIETDGGIYAPRDIGYSVYKSAEEAEAVLKEDQHGQDL